MFGSEGIYTDENTADYWYAEYTRTQRLIGMRRPSILHAARAGGMVGVVSQEIRRSQMLQGAMRRVIGHVDCSQTSKEDLSRSSAPH